MSFERDRFRVPIKAAVNDWPVIVNEEYREPIVANPEPATEPLDPFTKIPFNPRKGMEMVAPIRPRALKEIGKVERGDEVNELAAH